MASAGLQRRLAEAMYIGELVEIAIEPESNRRIHERRKANDLQWLRGARVKYGAAIRVLDISAGGLLLESEQALKPNATIVLELTGPDNPILIPSKVLRCRAASLGDILTYEGACAFKRPLTITELTPTPQPTVSIPHAPSVDWRKVMARFNDGRVVCGYTNNFHPSKPQLHLFTNLRDRESMVIPLAQLKALFFVREFTGDPTRAEAKFFSDTPDGCKMEVTLCDREVMAESTLSDRTEAHGLILRPGDPRSNILSVFATAAGIRHVRFL